MGEGDSLYNKWCWGNGVSTCGKMKLDPDLPLCTKINSKYIKDLHVRSEMFKLLEENRGETLQDTGAGKNLLKNMAAEATVPRIEK